MGTRSFEELAQQVFKATEEVLSAPIMLDPTIVVSPPHLAGLERLRPTLFLSATWVDLVQGRRWDDLDRVMRELSWRFGWVEREPSAREMRSLIVETVSIGRPFRASNSVIGRLQELYPGMWNLERPVDRVLADEYAFLLRHSAILTRIRRPYYALRDRGLAVMDGGDRFMAAKAGFFARHPRMKFLLGVLIPLEGLAEGVHPALRFLGILAQELLAFYDPEV